MFRNFSQHPVPHRARLQAMVEWQPGRTRTVDPMIGEIGISAGRLHALFRQALGQTPRA